MDQQHISARQKSQSICSDCEHGNHEFPLRGAQCGCLCHNFGSPTDRFRLVVPGVMFADGWSYMDVLRSLRRFPHSSKSIALVWQHWTRGAVLRREQ